MFVADRLTLGKPRRTSDGYLAVRARAARVGVQDYRGYEVDPEGKRFAADEMVPVYRPEEEVFAKDSVASFLMKPVTDDHPRKPVTADNWQEIAKGVIGQALRDGDFLAFDLVLMDGATIDKVEAGKRELSNGYSCEVDFGDGIAPDGTPYKATQRVIRGNHVAVVDDGRAGPECRIGDAAPCAAMAHDLVVDGQTYSAVATGDNVPSLNSQPGPTGRQHGEGQMATKTITFDGLPVEVTDAAEAVIRKLEGQVSNLTDAKVVAENRVGELTATISTKDGEITALQQQIKDAAVTPAKLQQLVADRAALIDTATKIVPAIVTDGKTDGEIRKEVVVAKLGDAAKDFDDNHVAGAFGALAATVPTTDAKIDPVRNAIIAAPVNLGDAATAYDAAVEKRKNDLRTAYLGAPAANVA